MIKKFFNSILSQKVEQEKEKENVPTFTITIAPPEKADFEVAELSFEEYTMFVNQDRRKTARAPQA